MKDFSYILLIIVMLSFLLTSCKAGNSETFDLATYSNLSSNEYIPSALEEEYDSMTSNEHAQPESKNSSDFSDNTDTDDSWVPPEPPENIPKVEVAEEETRYKNLISSLDSQKITKVEITKSDPPGSFNEVSYTSTDKKVIETWIGLLKRMKISGKAFEGISGQGYSLSLYETDRKVELGGYVFPCVYNKTTRTMVYIHNYDELQREFEAVEKLLSER